MRDLVSMMTDGLRVAITDDNVKDELLSHEMETLSVVAKSDSLEDIRRQLSRTVDLVSRVIRDRQARYEAQLQFMSERVHSLRTELVAMRERAEMDALTHLHNRGAFDEVLAKQIDFSFLSGQPVALVMVDLDHFKGINDSFGHPGGDLVLRKVADLLIRLFPRRSDLVARYGGEEFALILVDVGPEDLKPLGKRILNAVRALSIDCLGDTIKVTCSIGIASGTPHDNVETLLRRADHALYRAKQEGRDRVVFGE